MQEPELARPSDAEALLALREAAAQWMLQRGLTQWAPGELQLGSFQEQIAQAEWYVIRTEKGSVCAGLRLPWSDEVTWSHDQPVAGYVHGLVIARTSVGEGIGSELLMWAGRKTFARGRRLLRLDCVESNLGLRRYYREQGFREVGRRDFNSDHWHAVTLFERALP